MVDKISKSETEWRAKLTAEQFEITQHKGTEPAFSGKYFANKELGIYRCVCCGQELFDSESKYDSGTGWPSFFQSIASVRLTTATDNGHAINRTEVLCSHCDAHLGHVFDDGPDPIGMRYCINSAALDFNPKK